MNLSPFLLTIIWNMMIGFWMIWVVLLVSVMKNKLMNYMEYITALTVWLLLWMMFLGFMPELTSEGNLIWKELGVFILVWLFLFYLLELFLHWHHCKDLWHIHSCNSSHKHEHKNNLLMFWWTILHNVFHWMVLFSAFSMDLHFWMATTFAMLLHSIPQNMVNYIMNHNNMKYSYFAAFWWMLWALITYPFSNFLIVNKFYMLAIITWGLLYTALADIFPEFKGKWTMFKKMSYFILIVIWMGSFLLFESFM